MRKVIIVAVMLAFIAPAMASAYPGEQWRNRDASQILLKHNAYSEGWQWTTDSAGDQYCYPIIQRKQGRANNKLQPGRWYTEFVSDDMVVDWIKRRKGDPPIGQNPCLVPGAKAGKQPRAVDRHVVESRIIVEDLSEPAIGCPTCYRHQGVICYLAYKAEVDIRLHRADDLSHPDHGITKIAQACRDAGSNR